MWEAATLIRGMIVRDIRIVVLKPEMILDRNTDDMQVMVAIMELCRGNRESKRKNELIGANWQQWRDKAATSKEYRPSKRPFWLDRDGNGYRLNSHAATVRKIYQLASEGWGIGRIAKYLREHDLRPLTPQARRREKNESHDAPRKMTDGFLSPAYLAHVLKTPSVWGRCEDIDCDDYFPPVINKDVWHRVQAVIGLRKSGGGGRSEWVHLLKGLVCHRVTGAVYYRDVYVLYHKPHRVVGGTTQERLLWDTQRLNGKADVDAEDVWEYLRTLASNEDAERQAERRERKRLVCKAWHATRKQPA